MNMPSAVPSWPDAAECSARLAQLKKHMAVARVDALVVTSKPNFEYYTGFRSLFWLSDTRPFLAVVRQDRPDIAVVLSSVEARDAASLGNPDVTAIFYDGFTDAGISTAAAALDGLVSGARVGLDYGMDMMGRGSVTLVDRLRAAPNNFEVIEAAELIWRQRMVKSAHELAAKQDACAIATDAFFEGLGDLKLGMTEYEFAQLLKQRMIGLGADSVDWLPIRFGGMGMSYSRLNGGIALKRGDFVWADMGARRADQISDVNRIAKIGKATPEQDDIYGFVRGVTLSTAERVRPGMTGGDVFAIFQELWSIRPGLKIVSAGRVGHGSGISLTEPPSLMAASTEVILEDMVLHVEPKLEVLDGVFQVEEVFRVTAGGPEFLTKTAPEKLPIVDL
ncbi:M24 family metallopeptidase [Allomesorhizobium camelthorni]|uniref:Aminopeptidase P family protein n=1 Tax=Allomesorhizobium camelthorni TaxID=475069 RepID=A0A6G4WHP5_9HYPH|nr:Xaa-Pro peptidase family protein [Mesorhizobium camelthorni]NGO53888.1 aminopeptidase P family protein [Mesorhizobium camelthorni]